MLIIYLDYRFIFRMFADFWVLLNWAKELWAGNYTTSLYPPTFLMFYFPFLFLDDTTALALFLILSLIFFVLTFGYRSIYWILFLPALQTLLLAHPDTFFLFLFKKKTPLSLSLLTLKPVLFLVAIPDVIKFSTINKIKFLFYTGAIYSVSFIFLTNWPEIYLNNVLSNGLVDKRFNVIDYLISNNLILPVAIAVMIFYSKRNLQGLLALFVSFSFFMSYNYIFFTGTNILFIPLSWVFVNLQNPPWISFNYYFVIIPVFLYIKESELCQFMITNVRIVILNLLMFYLSKNGINVLNVLNVKRLSKERLLEQV